MSKLSHASYRALFLKHVYRFLGNVSSTSECLRPHVVAVSGGLDSMTLLWVAHKLSSEAKIGKVRAVFVHHHTRPGQDQDADFIQDFCQRHAIPFEVLHAQGLNGDGGNFEEKARRLRRQLLKANLKAQEWLWLGHHLDDSFEWSLMQRHRSGQVRSSLGIPVKNGSIIRPFLCVSKQQLRTLARQEGIKFREDPTNTHTRFDRNFLRVELSPLIRKRYPQYLKHYVKHANQMATLLKLNIIRQNPLGEVQLYQQGALIQSELFSPFQIQELLENFSNRSRGELSTPIQRMLTAIENGKKGPFQFSGGTEIYHSHHLLMLYQKNMKNADEAMAEALKQLSAEQLESLPTFSRQELEQAWTKLKTSSRALEALPGLVLVQERASVCKTLNASVYDSLFPAVSRVIQERKYCFVTALKCLETWERKREKLPERLRLLPLWALTNLFSSQE